MTISPFQREVPESLKQDFRTAGFFRSFVNTVYELFFFANEFAASTTQSITAGNGIVYEKRVTRVAGSGGAVTVTATPSIGVITDGKEIIIQGTDDTNTVTLQDESSLASSGLALAGGVNFTLGKGDILHLVYDANDSKYYEISRSNN